MLFQFDNCYSRHIGQFIDNMSEPEISVIETFLDKIDSKSMQLNNVHTMSDFLWMQDKVPFLFLNQKMQDFQLEHWHILSPIYTPLAALGRGCNNFGAGSNYQIKVGKQSVLPVEG